MTILSFPFCEWRNNQQGSPPRFQTLSRGMSSTEHLFWDQTRVSTNSKRKWFHQIEDNWWADKRSRPSENPMRERILGAWETIRHEERKCTNRKWDYFLNPESFQIYSPFSLFCCTGRDHNPQAPLCLGLHQWIGDGNDRETLSHLPESTPFPWTPTLSLWEGGLQSPWRLGLETTGITVDAQSCTTGLGLWVICG